MFEELISSFSFQAGFQEESQNLGYTEFQGDEDQSVQKLDDLVKKASSKCERLEALNLSRRSSREHSVNPIPRVDFSFSHNPSIQQDVLQMGSVPLEQANSLLIPDPVPQIQRDQSLVRETSVNAELRLWHELSQPKEVTMAVSQPLPAMKRPPGRCEEDLVSNSTADSKLQPAAKGKVNLVQLVTRMGNENALNISDYCTEFGIEEKTIVANLVYIKCPKSEISPTAVWEGVDQSLGGRSNPSGCRRSSPADAQLSPASPVDCLRSSVHGRSGSFVPKAHVSVNAHCSEGSPLSIVKSHSPLCRGTGCSNSFSENFPNRTTEASLSLAQFGFAGKAVSSSLQVAQGLLATIDPVFCFWVCVYI